MRTPSHDWVRRSRFPFIVLPVRGCRRDFGEAVNRNPLSLLIGMTLAGKLAPPAGDPSWQAIHYVNRADVAGRLIFIGMG